MFTLRLQLFNYPAPFREMQEAFGLIQKLNIPLNTIIENNDVYKELGRSLSQYHSIFYPSQIAEEINQKLLEKFELTDKDYTELFLEKKSSIGKEKLELFRSYLANQLGIKSTHLIDYIIAVLIQGTYFIDSDDKTHTISFRFQVISIIKDIFFDADVPISFPPTTKPICKITYYEETQRAKIVLVDNFDVVGQGDPIVLGKIRSCIILYADPTKLPKLACEIIIDENVFLQALNTIGQKKNNESTCYFPAHKIKQHLLPANIDEIFDIYQRRFVFLNNVLNDPDGAYTLDWLQRPDAMELLGLDCDTYVWQLHHAITTNMIYATNMLTLFNMKTALGLLVTFRTEILSASVPCHQTQEVQTENGDFATAEYQLNITLANLACPLYCQQTGTKILIDTLAIAKETVNPNWRVLTDTLQATQKIITYLMLCNQFGSILINPQIYFDLLSKNKEHRQLLLNTLGHFINFADQETQILIHDIYRLIARFPDFDGSRLSSEQIMNNWSTVIKELIDETSSPTRGETVTILNPQNKTIIQGTFKPEIAKQLLDGDRFKPKPKDQHGRHIALPTTNKTSTVITTSQSQQKPYETATRESDADDHTSIADECKVWFKLFPEQSGTSYAVQQLTQLLCGGGVITSTIAKYQKAGQNIISLQIMSHANGQSLSSLKQGCWAMINMESFTQQLIRVLCINPEDDREYDYYVTPVLEPTNKAVSYRLQRIDNDRAFFPVDKTTGKLMWKKQELLVKSILLCMDQMQQLLDETVIDEFLSLDVDTVLSKWLEDLIAINQGYEKLFDDKTFQNHLKRTEPGCSILAIALTLSIIQQLHDRITSFQQLCKLFKEHNIPLTGLDILSYLQPTLAQYYRAVFVKYPKTGDGSLALNRFHNLTTGAYTDTNISKVLNYDAISCSLGLDVVGKMVISKDLRKRIAADLTAALEWIKNRPQPEKFACQIYQGNLAEFNDQNLRAKRLVIKMILSELKQNPEVFNSKCKINILIAMQQLPFIRLDLTSFADALTDELLKPILKNAGNNLLVLDLSGCNQLSANLLFYIAQYCPNLKHLYLNKLTTLSVFIHGTTFSSNEYRTFLQLLTLSMNNCGNLQRLDIITPKLHVLSMINCAGLVYLSTRDKTLKRLDLTNCIKLTSTSLAKITANGFATLEQLTLTGWVMSPYLMLIQKYPFLIILANLSKSSGNYLSYLMRELDEICGANALEPSRLPTEVKQIFINIVCEKNPAGKILAKKRNIVFKSLMLILENTEADDHEHKDAIKYAIKTLLALPKNLLNATQLDTVSKALSRISQSDKNEMIRYVAAKALQQMKSKISSNKINCVEQPGSSTLIEKINTKFDWLISILENKNSSYHEKKYVIKALLTLPQDLLDTKRLEIMSKVFLTISQSNERVRDILTSQTRFFTDPYEDVGIMFKELFELLKNSSLDEVKLCEKIMDLFYVSDPNDTLTRRKIFISGIASLQYIPLDQKECVRMFELIAIGSCSFQMADYQFKHFISYILYKLSKNPSFNPKLLNIEIILERLNTIWCAGNGELIGNIVNELTKWKPNDHMLITKTLYNLLCLLNNIKAIVPISTLFIEKYRAPLTSILHTVPIPNTHPNSDLTFFNNSTIDRSDSYTCTTATQTTQ